MGLSVALLVAGLVLSGVGVDQDSRAQRGRRWRGVVRHRGRRRVLDRILVGASTACLILAAESYDNLPGRQWPTVLAWAVGLLVVGSVVPRMAHNRTRARQ